MIVNLKINIYCWFYSIKHVQNSFFSYNICCVIIRTMTLKVHVPCLILFLSKNIQCFCFKYENCIFPWRMEN